MKSTIPGKTEGRFLYADVLDRISRRIEGGLLRPGDRLPSLRSLARELGVSVPTVRQAYLELERWGRIEARPKSGYFVRPQISGRTVPKQVGRSPSRPVCATLVDEVFTGMQRRSAVPLGVADPTRVRPAHAALRSARRRVVARWGEQRIAGYAPWAGEGGLRRQIAMRYAGEAVEVPPDEVVVTNGGQESLALALQVVARPGDVVAVESPSYHGHLELIEALGMLALEVETCPQEGVVVGALEATLDAHPVAACLFAPGLNNPLGCRMPRSDHRRVVELLEERGIPLIEDDAYRELSFDRHPTPPGRVFSQREGVITCGSFSKTVSPSDRLGWVLGARWTNEISRRKRVLSGSSALLPQLMILRARACVGRSRWSTGLPRPIRGDRWERPSSK
ncbi:MAG: PLP-dependent aminotransferase family protein, partial [Myxococcota bacterium]